MYNPHWHGKKSYGADGCGYEQRFTGNGGILPAGKTGVLNQDARSLQIYKRKMNCQTFEMDIMGFRAAYSGNG